MSRLIDDTMRWLTHLDRTAWLVILVCVFAAGAYCLKGFGSRAKY